jgi:iron complex outermembrane recepter protein
MKKNRNLTLNALTTAILLALTGHSINALAETKSSNTSNQKAQSQETSLAPITVTDKTVNEINNPDYRRTDTTTATKMDTPIMETPYAVTVVPQQVLKDKQITRVEDAINTVAGVQSSWTNGGQSDVFIMRGFQNTNLYLDGFLMPSALGGGTSKRQVANLDRIEVLKGAGSILYGRSEPGGVINMVTKRPQAERYNSIQQQFGSFGLFRTLVDSTGKITSDDTLLYRVNLSYENAGSYRDFVKTDAFFIAPSLTWNISDMTQANLDVQYEHFDNRSDSGISPMGNRPAPVPISRQFGDPLNNSDVGDRTYVAMSWWHKFNDNWKISHRFGAEFLDKTSLFTFYSKQPDALGNFVNINADASNWGDNYRGFNSGVTQQQNYYTTLNLTGKFNTTSYIEHSTLWGFDYFMIDNQGSSNCSFVNTFCQADYASPTFNIFNPTYQTVFNPSASTFEPIAKFNQEWYGLYFQDQIKFPFNIYGNVGVRYDNATTTSHQTNGDTISTTDNHVSPRGGLLWKPVNWLSVFGNYSQNFGPSNNMWNSPNQKALPPTLAHQWETGVKTEFFDKRLSASFTYFDLTKTNIAQTVITADGGFVSKAIGEQETRGYEFELAGEILPGWRTVAAYTHMPYAKITKGDVDSDGNLTGLTGNRMYNASRNFGSILSTYEFQNGTLRGLKVGGSVAGASRTFGDYENTYQLPGYVTFNLLGSYGMKVAGKQLTFQLNANNLLDRHYYSGSNTWSMIGVAPPRNFMGSVKLEF